VRSLFGVRLYLGTMVSLETFRKLVMAFPEVEESVHAKTMMFGVRKKRFASFDPRNGDFALKLPLADPDRLQGLEQEFLCEIPGRYGSEGWTLVKLEKIGKREFARLLETAHGEMAAIPVASKGKRLAKD